MVDVTKADTTKPSPGPAPAKAEAPKTTPPKPKISGLKPASATDAPEQDLEVSGSNFTMGSRITLNGVEMPTKIESDSKLSTSVVMKEVRPSATSGVIHVTVRDGDTETDPSDWKVGDDKAKPEASPMSKKEETTPSKK